MVARGNPLSNFYEELLLGLFGGDVRLLSIGLGVGSVALATFSAAGIRLERGAAALATVVLL